VAGNVGGVVEAAVLVCGHSAEVELAVAGGCAVCLRTILTS
jgi:hypothetical protein